MTELNLGKLLADKRWVGKIFNGAWVTAQGGARDVPEPASGKTLSHTGFGNALDIDAATAIAAAAQPAWATLGARDRAGILRRLRANPAASSPRASMKSARPSRSCTALPRWHWRRVAKCWPIRPVGSAMRAVSRVASWASFRRSISR